MSPVDYMKVLDVASKTFNAASEYEFRAIDLKIFQAGFTLGDGSVVEIEIRTGEYDLELFISKNNFDSKRFSKWLSEFEYNLEQNFFTNISLEHSETANEYKIKVIF